jgi:plasmid stability protein
MATIQIRDVPEEAYEILRRRARAEGRSIQTYMRERVIELATTPAKAELAAAIERALEERGAAAGDPAAIAEDVAAERR